ncbi:MAG: hypothetical protein C0391_03770 [Anaerolinea sp.]|nr:hypothetical protein [Anaerolinea sp.]
MSDMTMDFVNENGTLNDLYYKGLERKRRAAEIERNRRVEHEVIMTSAWRARDFETAAVIPAALRAFLEPTGVNLDMLPMLDKFTRVCRIPEFAPFLINLVKEDGKWRLTNRSLKHHDIETYLVCGVVLDAEAEIVDYEDWNAVYCGPDLELALVAAKEEYSKFQEASHQLKLLIESRKQQKKELAYLPVDPPVPTDQQALEALNSLIEQAVEKKMKHI